MVKRFILPSLGSPIKRISMEQKTQSLPAQKNIALVAHDGKKAALKLWCEKHKKILSQHTLYGTGTTGHLIQKLSLIHI